MKEFELIKHFFTEQIVKRKDVIKGIGDDCAIIDIPAQQNVVVTTDTLVSGVHFPHDTHPNAIGHKAIAVNLSDIAAMGAEPCWISIAITLPKVDKEWLQAFCDGVFELCEYYNVELIGGDTTQGPLSITVTAQGLIPEGKSLLRSGAQSGDWLYVTGEVGDAALALKHFHKQISLPLEYIKPLREKLDRPKARVLAGQAIREYASSAIDLSDGLVSDLNHICQASDVGANIVLDKLPLSQMMLDSLPFEEAASLALVGGDDYEILFTVSEDNKVGMETALANTGTKITCIGQTNKSKVVSTTINNQVVPIQTTSFEHFTDK